MIHYLCPDIQLKSAGVRILYRHVEILCRNGISATILHNTAGFRVEDMPDVPVTDLKTPAAIKYGDMVVVPEVLASYLPALKAFPLQLMVIAMNWKYVYENLPNEIDYRTHGVKRVITQSPHIADFVNWAMGLPTHAFIWGIKGSHYYYEREKKIPQVAFIARKQECVREFANVLHSRDRKFISHIKWLPLQGFSESEYAAEVRRSQLFLNLSNAEGLPCSLLEAMRAGTLVAGWNSVGGQRELIGEGKDQNCVLAENLDYVSLARRVEPLLQDMIAGDMSRWDRVRTNGFTTSETYTEEAEEASVVAMWRGILQSNPTPQQ